MVEESIILSTVLAAVGLAEPPANGEPVTPSINESLQKLQQLSDTILELTQMESASPPFPPLEEISASSRSLPATAKLLQTALFTYWFEDGVGNIVPSVNRAEHCVQSNRFRNGCSVQQMEQRQQTIRVGSQPADPVLADHPEGLRLLNIPGMAAVEARLTVAARTAPLRQALDEWPLDTGWRRPVLQSSDGPAC